MKISKGLSIEIFGGIIASVAINYIGDLSVIFNNTQKNAFIIAIIGFIIMGIGFAIVLTEKKKE